MPTPPLLTPPDLDALAEGGGTPVVDTRAPADFRRGHVPGALLAPPRGGGEGWGYVGGGEVVLVAEGARVDEAVGEAEAAGLSVQGVITPDVLAAWGEGNDKRRMLKAIDFDELDGRRHYTNVLVLDVRDAEAWEARHVPGSVNIPAAELAGRLGELPRDRTVLVHCQRGARSAAAAALLHAQGFCVAHVDDDLARWKERHRQPGVTAGAH